MGANDLQSGARNLVEGCAGVRSGQRVAVIAEDPSLGWYDAIAPQAVAEAAGAAGADVSVHPVGGPTEALAPDIARALDRADVAIFFARIGDHGRFEAGAGDCVKVMSYARTARCLASGFGRRDHARMVALKQAVDLALAETGEITIRCPRGTDLRSVSERPPPELADVGIRRFPMCVPAPVCARGLEGRVVLADHLVSTGARAYAPSWITVPGPVAAHVAGGRIARFEGAPDAVARVEAHYTTIAARFGIDRDAVHSWHAGIHDGCDPGGPFADPDHWANSVFGNPGYLHFHTCGDYAPGEICWMVAQPTITAGGRDIWRDGELCV